MPDALRSKRNLDRVDKKIANPSVSAEGFCENPDSVESARYEMDNRILADMPNLYKQNGVLILDKVESRNKKPSDVAEGQPSENSDSGESVRYESDSHIVSDAPNLYKPYGVSMSKRNFVQLNRCDQTDELQRTDPNLFLFFSWAARKAQRTYENNFFDLDPGEVMVSRETNAFDCGLTPKEMRCAIDRGIAEGYFAVTFNPTCKKGTQKEELTKREKRAIKRAIKCKIIKILNTDFFDINSEEEGQQKGERWASDGPAMGHIQEREEREEYKKESSSSSESMREMEIQKKKRIFSKDGYKNEFLSSGWTDGEFEEAWKRYLDQPDGKVKKFHGWFLSVLKSVRMDFLKKDEKEFEKRKSFVKIEKESKIAAEKLKISQEEMEKELLEETSKIKEKNEKLLNEFLKKYPQKVIFKGKMFHFVTKEIGMGGWFSIEEPIQSLFLGLVEASIKLDCESEKNAKNSKT